METYDKNGKPVILTTSEDDEDLSELDEETDDEFDDEDEGVEEDD